MNPQRKNNNEEKSNVIELRRDEKNIGGGAKSPPPVNAADIEKEAFEAQLEMVVKKTKKTMLSENALYYLSIIIGFLAIGAVYFLMVLGLIK